MVGVGDVAQVFRALEFVEIELRGVRQEELVAAGVHDELGLSEPIAVLEGFLNFHEGPVFRSSLPVHDPLLDVIADGRGVIAVGLEVVLEGRLDI